MLGVLKVCCGDKGGVRNGKGDLVLFLVGAGKVSHASGDQCVMSSWCHSVTYVFL